jgi:hypothetical protein
VSSGELIRAEWSEAEGRTVRYGELTAAVLQEHPAHTIGRVTDTEREAIQSNAVTQRASVVVVPVNADYEVTELRAFRLGEGLSMIVGQRREDGALVARALSFREPQFDLTQAEDTALRWGFITAAYREAALVVPEYPAPIAPPTADEVAAAIASRAGAAVAGFNFTAAMETFQMALATTVAQATAEAVAQAMDESGMTIRNGKKSWIYLTCPTCGAVQDAANAKCPRCNTDLAAARRAMFAQGDPPIHYNPPPPIRGQPDTRDPGD